MLLLSLGVSLLWQAWGKSSGGMPAAGRPGVLAVRIVYAHTLVCAAVQREPRL